MPEFEWTRFKRSLTPYMFLLPALVFMVVFIYQPIVQSFRYSLYKWSAFSVSESWKYVGFDNYTRVFKDDIFYGSIVNNVWYAVISVAVQVCFGLVLAALLESHSIVSSLGAGGHHCWHHLAAGVQSGYRPNQSVA